MAFARTFGTLLSLQSASQQPKASTRIKLLVMTKESPFPVSDRREFLASVAGGVVATSWSANAQAATYLEPGEFRGAQSVDFNSNLPPFVTLPSGVRILDIKEGKGEEVTEGKAVSCQWVLRDSRGYYVDGSPSHDGDSFIYRNGNKQAAIPGFDEGLRGMRAGGRRRFTVPPELAYQTTGDGAPGPMPEGFGPRRQIETKKGKETWTFEVEVTRVRS